MYEPEEDYHKPQKVKSAFEDEYIEYESNGDEGKSLSIEEYLDMIRPYLSHIIDYHKDGWKIQLTAELTFVSVKDSNGSSTRHISSGNLLIFGYETNNIIKDLFKSFLGEYQESLKTKMKKSDFVFDSVDALYCKLHKISLNRRGSYIDSPEWLKNKKQQ